MSPRAARVAKGVLAFVLVGYALVCVVFAAIQAKLLYFPHLADAHEESLIVRALGAERVTSRHGDTLGYRVRAGERRATLVFAHGNGGSALGQERVVRLARESGLGLDVFLVEYPGYGTRKGAPRQAENVEAVLEAIALCDDAPVILFGESLGSAVVAIAAAQRRDVVRGVVLVTPLPSLVGPTRHHYPFLPTFLLRDRYEGDAALARFGGPSAFVVASEDEVIPAELALAMHSAYRGEKVLFVEPGAHHNTVDYTPTRPTWQGVFAFLSRALTR